MPRKGDAGDKRQRVHDMLRQGKTQVEIGRCLGLTKAGVKHHVVALRRIGADLTRAEGASIPPARQSAMPDDRRKAVERVVDAAALVYGLTRADLNPHKGRLNSAFGLTKPQLARGAASTVVEARRIGTLVDVHEVCGYADPYNGSIRSTYRRFHAHLRECVGARRELAEVERIVDGGVMEQACACAEPPTPTQVGRSETPAPVVKPDLIRELAAIMPIERIAKLYKMPKQDVERIAKGAR